jgi:hypothetical protein
MPRLSPVDQAFFLLETQQRPMNIGALLVLVPPKGAGSTFADQLVRTMLKRPVGPPFNYRLTPGPVKGLYALATDEHMDHAPQMRRHRLPADADRQGLFEHICRMHVKLLPRDKPLWEQHVFTGLPGHRVGSDKTHHGLIDGIGFIRGLNTMITTSPTARCRARAGRAANAPHQPQVRAGAWPRGPGWPRTQRTSKHAPTRVAPVARIGLARAVRSFVRDAYSKPPSARVLGRALPWRRYARATQNQRRADDFLDLACVATSRQGRPTNRSCPTCRSCSATTAAQAVSRSCRCRWGTGNTGAAARRRRAGTGRSSRKCAPGPRGLKLCSIVQRSIASTIQSLGLSELPMLANAVISTRPVSKRVLQ